MKKILDLKIELILKTKKWFSIVLLFIIPYTLSAQDTITLANGEWVPYQSKDLHHYGLASHIVTEAFALQGIKVNYVFRPWGRAYTEAKEGNVDGSLIWIRTDEREKYFYFSDVVIRGNSVLFHLKSYPFNWSSHSDLHGLTVGGVVGYSYKVIEALETAGKLHIYRAVKDLDSFKMLFIGRVNVVQLDSQVGYHILNKYFTPEEASKITHHPKPISSDIYHLILSKKSDKNIQRIKLFNKGLSELKANGQYHLYITDSKNGKYQKTN